MKKVIAMLLSLVMVLGMAACGGTNTQKESQTTAEDTAEEGTEETEPAESEAEAETETGSYKIGFSVKTLTNEPFQAFIADMIQTKVEEAGCEFVLATTDSAEDVAQQVSQIEDMLVSGIDALIVNPLD